MAVREIMGLSSNRPEMRCPSTAVLQQFEDIEWKRNLETNLNQCSTVIHVEAKCAISLEECEYCSPENPSLFRMEKGFLDLSSASLTDAIFYCSLFTVNNILYCRYFESGTLSGYFLSEGIQLIKQIIPELDIPSSVDLSKLVWCQISTQDDIGDYYERYTKKLERKRSHRARAKLGTDVDKRYSPLLTTNKHSIVNCHRMLMAKAQLQRPSDSCQLLGTVVSVIKHDWQKQTNPLKARDCLSRNPTCQIEYSGNHHSLHFLTRETAAGDEIGWDFVTHALNCHITFSSFCKIMTKKYEMFNHSSAKFMSVQSFISWWFSWSSRFNIDFCKPCHICKFGPKYLACDGTKIGINFRHCNIDPIETPNTEDLIDPCHRRNDRAFLSFKPDDSVQNKNVNKCRDHLLYMSKKKLGLLKESEILSLEKETNKSILLISILEEECKNFVRKFVCNDYPQHLSQKLAVIFKILSSSHSLTSFIPFRYVDFFNSILMELYPHRERSVLVNKISGISEFSPEIRDVLHASTFGSMEVLLEVVNFFKYLVCRVRKLKLLNKEPSPAIPKVGSYNPEKFGVAYYFNPTGEKLRDLPVYTMNSSAYSKNYDDRPAPEGGLCNKIYPEVSRKGTTYLFLWFDPKHYGHCYGFHMITSSEGRKDPFSSAYCYLEKAPNEVFYDFACQFEEYSLNREPGFWENTRFWHDLFHGYNHKCPSVYKSQRIVSLQNLNTEICEQFNSFIQKIKYSARSMTLSKFCYYLQFMIYQWCEKKRAAFQKRCGIATAYLA